MDPARRAFYRFHASLMEPWDGPASVAFTDGTRGRRGARPQRPAPGPLVAHRRRPGRARPARPACSTSTRPPWSPRAACSRAGCSWSTPRPGRIVDDDEIKAELAAAAAVRRLAARRADATWTTCPPREHVVYTHDSVQRRQQTFGYTEEELKILLGADGPGRRRAARLDGHRHPDLAAVAPGRGCSTTTSTSSSRRSPTRRWTRSARSWSPACRSTIGPGGQPARPGPGELPADRAAVPGHRQRRAGQDPLHRRGRRPARLQGGPGLRALPAARRRGRASRPG